MFGIGGTELLVILVVALIVLGPKSVPQIARTLGKAMGEFRKVSTEAEKELFGTEQKATAATKPAEAASPAAKPAAAATAAAPTETDASVKG